ncbi:MAG: response regulator [Candidatus Omnitrophica bacterium]|nr:response regulator [Candidatus Omnitrophota bacterium]
MNTTSLNKRVLVAEDETEARNLFCEVVTKCGFTAIEARDGAEAIRMVSTWDRLDAIILDIKMPNMHGYQVIEKLREMKKHIPIIVCTAFQALHDDASVMSYPGIVTMEKPVSLNELKKTLEDLVLAPK